MSTHVIPGTVKEAGWALGPPLPDGSRPDLQADRRQRVAQRAFGMCVALLRTPSGLTDNGTSMVLTFTPDLSAPEVTTLGRLLRTAASSAEVTVTERDALEADIAALIAFQTGTPTLVQTVAAVRAQSRIIRAILRS